MDTFFGVILVIIFLLIVMRPMLHRWFAPMFQRWALGKMEDNMRRMAGMPTRKEERKARKHARQREKAGAENFRRAAGGRRRTGPGQPPSLQEYAEDVEFTEVKTFSQNIDIGSTEEKHNEQITEEEQIEDAEFVEIKNPKIRK